MTTKLKCSCGHEGSIRMKENDQPFSGAWEKHTLHGFNGNSPYEVSGRYVPTSEVFENLAPICPYCGATITSNNVTK